MMWTVEFLPEADNSLPQNQGGYGKSLGNHSSSNLANLLKIKFKNIGLRIF